MDVSDQAALFAAAASVIALWFAFRSTQIARKAYELALVQDERRQPDLEVRLLESFTTRSDDGTIGVYVFDIAIANRSEADNGIRELLLELVLDRGTDIHSNLATKHDPALAAMDITSSTEVLRVPSVLPAYTVTSGRALFSVPRELVRGVMIESYTLRVVDTRGRPYEREVIFINEPTDERVA